MSTENDRPDTIESLREENAKLNMAIGLMTTAKGDMVVDVRNPIAMAREIVEEVERLRLYENEYISVVNACAWMHDDKTLDLQLGDSLPTSGVIALKQQRDQLRAENERLERKYESTHSLHREKNSVIQELRASLSTAVDALEKVPDKVLDYQRGSPAWSKSEIWGIERDIIPVIRLEIGKSLAQLRPLMAGQQPATSAQPPFFVRIIACSDPLFWYANRIGQLIAVERVDSYGYWAREGGVYNPINWIKTCDAVPTQPPAAEVKAEDRPPKIHQLKTWPEFFERLLDGSKTFELRKNDRDFRTGDLLVLYEYDPATDYTGRVLYRDVSYVLKDRPDFGITDGYAVLGLTSAQAGKGAS